MSFGGSVSVKLFNHCRKTKMVELLYKVVIRAGLKVIGRDKDLSGICCKTALNVRIVTKHKCKKKKSVFPERLERFRPSCTSSTIVDS
jgi:hypothetical protein